MSLYGLAGTNFVRITGRWKILSKFLNDYSNETGWQLCAKHKFSVALRVMNVKCGFLLTTARSNTDSCQVENCVRQKLNKLKKRGKYIFLGLQFWVFYYVFFFSFIIACHFNYNHDNRHLRLENYSPVTE